MTTQEKDKLIGKLIEFSKEASKIELLEALTTIGVGIQLKTTSIDKIDIGAIQAKESYLVLREIKK